MTVAPGAVDPPAVAGLALIYDRPEGRAGPGRKPQGYRVTGHPVPMSRSQPTKSAHLSVIEQRLLFWAQI